MEVNKLYKGSSGLTILCTGVHGDLGFSGIVVIGNERYKVGYKNDFTNGNTWNNKSFKLFDINNTTGLKEGVTYNIPKGCVATISNGQVLIESSTKYIKHNLEDFTIYSRHISGGKTTIVTFYCHGDVVVERSLEMSSADISDCGKEIDEDVFVDAYKRALKNLEL